MGDGVRTKDDALVTVRVMIFYRLTDVAAYGQLTGRAKSIGFEVTRVVFRGYGAPQRLQKMHDDAIERRTKLVLDRENEDQEQRLQDMKLEHEEARLRKRQQM